MKSAIRNPQSAMLAVVVACSGSALAFADTVNRIVAIVNDEVITEADVTSRVTELLEDEEGRPKSSLNPSEMNQLMLRHLIEQRLMLQEARRANVSVTPEEIAERLDTIKARFGSEEEFEEMLAQSQLPKEQLKQQIREQLMVKRLIDVKIRSAITISPRDVAKELSLHPELAKPGDRVLASHLLIRVTENRSEEQARALIEDLHRQLAEGADFASLAKRYSEDANGAEGGVMRWVAQGELLPELDATLFSLKAGELSSPIQTRLGFHLVRVDERRPAEYLSMAEANRTVYEQLYQRKFEETFTRWLSGLTQRAYIEVLGSKDARRNDQG
jgi:parvulin-like peptidyl-prolyl isomerase